MKRLASLWQTTRRYLYKRVRLLLHAGEAGGGDTAEAAEGDLLLLHLRQAEVEHVNYDLRLLAPVAFVLHGLHQLAQFAVALLELELLGVGEPAPPTWRGEAARGCRRSHGPWLW